MDFDGPGEIAAVRIDLADIVDHQARQDRRLTEALTGNFNTMDRLALALGRLGHVEHAQKRQGRMLEALLVAHGLPVPP